MPRGDKEAQDVWLFARFRESNNRNTPAPGVCDNARLPRRRCRTLGHTKAQGSKAYRKFIDEGRHQGHDERYYQAVDQRFLGDEKFIEQIAEVSFEVLLRAVAQVYGCKPRDLTAAGRRRTWAKSRAQLAYLAREWCAMKAVEIARRLHRDASMVSRLCANYETDRDAGTETKIADLIGQ